MQLRLPWDHSAPLASDRHLVVLGRHVPVEIVRHRLARRYVVRLTRDGSVRLTIPRGASITAGLAFAARQTDWIEREWRRHDERAAPWGSDTTVWFRGELVTLVVAPDRIILGPDEIRRAAPDSEVRLAIEAHLRSLANAELPTRCLELAREKGMTIARVSVRDQRSRWGACSSKRVITLNWRLVQMPTSVSDYILLHELMHVRQPNHSRRFWREVESVCDWWRDAERWLRRHGREIL